MSAQRYGIISHWGKSGPYPRIVPAKARYNTRFAVIIPNGVNKRNPSYASDCDRDTAFDGFVR